MKKVIILGSSGELGNYLSLKLSKSYDIIAVNRNDSKNYIDFSDRKSITKFLDCFIAEIISSYLNKKEGARLKKNRKKNLNMCLSH